LDVCCARPCAKGQVRARGHEINIVGLPPFEALKDLTTDILLFIKALLTPGFLATSKKEWALDVMQGRTRLELQRSAGMTNRVLARPDNVVLPGKSNSGSHGKVQVVMGARPEARV